MNELTLAELKESGWVTQGYPRDASTQWLTLNELTLAKLKASQGRLLRVTQGQANEKERPIKL